MHLSASSIMGDSVTSVSGEDLGKIEDLMVDVSNGTVKYAVLSFGGFLGMGEKLFAAPLETLELNAAEKSFILKTSKERLESAPGFDKSNWPNTADPEWQQVISNYYNMP